MERYVLSGLLYPSFTKTFLNWIIDGIESIKSVKLCCNDPWVGCRVDLVLFQSLLLLYATLVRILG